METVGYAALQIIPSAAGIGPAIGRQVSAPMASAGTSAGGRFRTGLLGSMRGIAGPLVATLGVAAIGSFVKGVISEASDLNESVNAVNVTFGKSADGILQLGQNAATTMGLSANEFNGFAVQFSNFAKTVSASGGGTVTGVMSDLTGRVADFASVMNLDVPQAAELFQSSLAGETEPIRRYGIDLSAATVAQFAYREGIAKTGAQLTQQQSVQARYQLLMKDTAKNQGDFANTSGGLANAQRILSAEFKNVEAELGGALLPAAAGVVSFFANKLLPVFTAFIDFLGSGDSIGSGLAEALNIPGDAPILQVIANIRQTVLDFVHDLQSGGITKAISGLFGGGGGAGGGGLEISKTIANIKKDITALITGAKALFEDLKPDIVSIANTFRQDVIPAVIRFWNAIQPAVRFFIQEAIPLLGRTLGAIITIFKGLFQIIGGLLDFLTGVFTGDWGRAWDGIKQIVAGVWNVIKGIVVAAFGNIIAGAGRALGKIGGLFASAWGAITHGVSAAWNWIVSKITGVIGHLGAQISQTFHAYQNVIGNVWDFIKRITSATWSWITGKISGAVHAVTGFISGAWHTVQALTSAAWQAFTSTISNGIGRAIDYVSRIPGRIQSTLSGAADWLRQTGIDMINGLINGAAELLPHIGEFFLDLLPGWIVTPFKKALGIESPSKLFFGFGQLIVAGLAAGIYDGKGKVEQATKDMAQRAMDAAKAILDQKQELARTVLSFARDIASSIADYGSVAAFEATTRTNAMGQEITNTGTGAVLGDLHDRLRAARDFGKQLVRLKRLGLNNSSLQEIIGAGPEAGSQIAQALLQGGQRAIRETNQLERAFQRTGHRIANVGTQSQYGTSTSQARAVAGARLTFHRGAVQLNFQGDPGKQEAKRIKNAVHDAFEDIIDRLEAREGRRG